MTHRIFPAMGVMLMALATSTPAQQPQAKSSGWILSTEDLVVCDSCAAAIHFRATRDQVSAPIHFEIPNISTTSVKILGSNAIFTGFAGRELETMIIHDLAANKTQDKVDGINFKLSPSGRYAAFHNFYSWHDPRFLMSDVILLYDATRSPNLNRVPKYSASANEFTAGIPIFPQGNKAALEPSPMKNSPMTVLNLLWSSSGNSLGFIAEATSPQARIEKGYKTTAVILGFADLSNGIDRMHVYIKTVPIQDVLRPEHRSDSIRFFADNASISDGGLLQFYGKSIWQLKPQFTINLISDHDEVY
jgi:hypothetical protein